MMKGRGRLFVQVLQILRNSYIIKHLTFPPHFYLFTFQCLKSQGVQHHVDSVSSGLRRKIASEFGTNNATVSMSTSGLTFPLIFLVLSGLPPGVTVFFALYTKEHFLPKQNSVLFQALASSVLRKAVLYSLLFWRSHLSQQKWPWTTTFQTDLHFRNSIPSRRPHVPRWKKGNA